MIVGDLKPMEDILPLVAGFNHVHVMGCGTCVSVCLAGGEREALIMAKELEKRLPDRSLKITASSIERQCEKDMVAAFADVPKQADAILSLACGCGVQTMADIFDPVPVYAALDTTFMGASDAPGLWNEKCRGCGDCILSYTGGICPVSRCAKSLFNGPCGGSKNGSCEVAPDIPCAWAMIYLRLKKQGRLEMLSRMHPFRDWRAAGGLGPRKRIRTGVLGSPGD